MDVLSLVNVMCHQLDLSVTGRSLIRKNHSECVCVCDQMQHQLSIPQRVSRRGKTKKAERKNISDWTIHTGSVCSCVLWIVGTFLVSSCACRRCSLETRQYSHSDIVRGTLIASSTDSQPIFIVNPPPHPIPLLQQIRNYTLDDLNSSCNKYKHKRPIHILLLPAHLQT